MDRAVFKAVFHVGFGTGMLFTTPQSNLQSVANVLSCHFDERDMEVFDDPSPESKIKHHLYDEASVYHFPLTFKVRMRDEQGEFTRIYVVTNKEELNEIITRHPQLKGSGITTTPGVVHITLKKGQTAHLRYT